jgi:phosphoglycolate phosphatase
VAEQAQLYPGIADVLDTLSMRQIPMAILSNKPHPIAIDTCKALLKEWKFEAIEGYKDEARRKPNPQTLLEIVTRMECQPEETVLLGDSATDMATALAGGVIPIGATWGYRSAHELRQAGACRLIDHAHQFIELL